MKTRSTSSLLALCAFTAGFALAPDARATDEKVMTNRAGPASAASAPTARRTLKFTSHHMVPGTLTLSRASAIEDGWKPQVRFAGQTDMAACEIHLPKAGQKVQPGETAVITIKCTTPWQVYDNGLSYTAYENGKKVGDGTLRP